MDNQIVIKAGYREEGKFVERLESKTRMACVDCPVPDSVDSPAFHQAKCMLYDYARCNNYKNTYDPTKVPPNNENNADA